MSFAARLALALVLPLAACGSGPTGDWVGVEPITAEEGTEFRNRMTVGGGGAADGTLFFVAPNTETSQQQLSVFELPFSATWDRDGDVVVFDVTCGEGCAFVMDCDHGDTLDCDSTPDFYADDAAYLRWTPADE